MPDAHYAIKMILRKVSQCEINLLIKIIERLIKTKCCAINLKL